MNRLLGAWLAVFVTICSAACGTTTGVVLGAPAAGGPQPSEGSLAEASTPEAAGEGGSPLVDVSVEVNGDAATGEQGGATGTPFTDVCPDDEVVIGYQGFLSGPGVGLTLIGGIQTMCGSLSVNPSSPGQVLTAEGAILPLRGAGQGNAWTQSCPADQVVVGFAGRSGADLDQVAFECAPWAVEPDGGGGLSAGVAVTLGAAGGDGGAPYMDTCPAGLLARGSVGRSGEWVDAFGLLCGTPALASAGP